ncbi:hypothetical protein [Geomesophilobacter sediminis]|uniref:Uncharacterized protein n=1 Tax=Geomesophilobacter sediminis TaxID=2798584 RepID=A0A8J7S8C5_9BACT|nr:hypothetical protein [Geomesophilobacter sediminis]MBJ6727586.1 hypothetical protein [Geomesophilobacter sediminis]
MKSETVILEAQGVVFFSQHDEAAFFEWLGKLDCVTNYEGAGIAIDISVEKDKVDEVQMRELLSLFNRYKINMNELAVLDCPEFSTWLHDEGGYWYKSMFG